jgi:hypothetical protein
LIIRWIPAESGSLAYGLFTRIPVEVEEYPRPARRLEHTSRAHEAEARAFLNENRPALPEFRLAQAPSKSLLRCLEPSGVTSIARTSSTGSSSGRPDPKSRRLKGPECRLAEGLRTGLQARAGRRRQTLAPAALAQTMISALTEVVAERLSERREDLFNLRSCLRTSCRPKEPRGPGRAEPRLPPCLAPRAPAPRSRSPRSSSEESSPPPPPVCRQSP